MAVENLGSSDSVCERVVCALERGSSVGGLGALSTGSGIASLVSSSEGGEVAGAAVERDCEIG